MKNGPDFCEQLGGINFDDIAIIFVTDQELVDTTIENYRIPPFNLEKIPNQAILTASMKSLHYNNFEGKDWEDTNEDSKQEMKKSHASDVLAGMGGGAYNYDYSVEFEIPIIYMLAPSEMKKQLKKNMKKTKATLFHELGHIKQANVDSINSQNTHRMIQEYHNVLYYENIYHVSCGRPLRLSYDEEGQYILKQLPSDIDWERFQKDVANNGQFDKNLDEFQVKFKSEPVLKLIETKLGEGQFNDEDVEKIKQNLMKEYYFRNELLDVDKFEYDESNFVFSKIKNP